uniref:Uncharacterized protein n=1 Tax=Anguilla anguilla TaxID=7936 RepID=A0A0E9W414_ANGAN
MAVIWTFSYAFSCSVKKDSAYIKIECICNHK